VQIKEFIAVNKRISWLLWKLLRNLNIPDRFMRERPDLPDGRHGRF